MQPVSRFGRKHPVSSGDKNTDGSTKPLLVAPPASHRTCGFHRIRRSTALFGRLKAVAQRPLQTLLRSCLRSHCRINPAYGFTGYASTAFRPSAPTAFHVHIFLSDSDLGAGSGLAFHTLLREPFATITRLDSEMQFLPLTDLSITGSSSFHPRHIRLFTTPGLSEAPASFSRLYRASHPKPA